MRERLRRDAPARRLLEPVVTDRRRGAKALVHVARIQQLPLRRRMAPHAGEAVGLQLQPHRERVAARRILLHRALHLPADSEHVLHVVPHLVGDHVGLREVAGCSESAGQLAVEAQVDVYALVGRAIEGPHLGGRSAASRLHLVPEEHELRLAVPADLLLPDLLGVVERRDRDPLQRRFCLPPLIGLRPWRLRGRAVVPHQREEVLPEDDAEDTEQQKAADSEPPAGDQSTAVFHVGAIVVPAQAHVAKCASPSRPVQPEYHCSWE